MFTPIHHSTESQLPALDTPIPEPGDSDDDAAQAQHQHQISLMQQVHTARVSLKKIPELWQEVGAIFKDRPMQLALTLLDRSLAEVFTKHILAGDWPQVSDIILTCASPHKKMRAPELAVPIEDLRHAWQQAYTGPALETFRHFINHRAATFDESVHYAKVAALVQSSGVGKSRLVDEFGKVSVGVTFTLRSGGHRGYP